MKEDLFALKAAAAGWVAALGAFLGWKGVMLLIWAAVMVLDYISGTVAACKEGRWSSAVAREGLWHKAGMIFAVTAAALGDVALALTAEFLPLELPWPGLLLPMVLAWYILTELGSILENAVEMGAAVPGWLVKLLKAGVAAVEAAGEE